MMLRSVVPDDPPIIRALVVSPVRLYRDGLVDALSRQAHVAACYAAADTDEALAQVRALEPDVALVDGSTADGLATAVALADTRARVITFGIPDTAEAVLACAEAGVKGYATSSASIGDLLAAVVSVARGEVLCSPRAAAALFDRVARLASRSSQVADVALDALTAREREIVALVTEGLQNKAIAYRLGIELATVKNHVHHILEKLGVRRRGEIAHRVATYHRPLLGVDLRTGRV